jgi:hypothetical protein
MSDLGAVTACFAKVPKAEGVACRAEPFLEEGELLFEPGQAFTHLLEVLV